MENTNVLFDRKRLVRLIVPLIVEQVLAVTVGMADMVMVSGAGETAVSGISLVNTICVLLIVIFTSMASGGSVVGAQFLGSGDKKTACHAAEQLVMICGLIAQQEARRMKEENYEVVVFQHRDLRHFLMRMRKDSAEENDAAQPFFFDDLDRGVYLICLFLYSLNNAGVFLFSHNLFSTSLNSKRFFDTLERIRDVFREYTTSDFYLC